MSALRGLRGVIAPPFYFVIPPVVASAFAVITAVVAGMIGGESLDELVPWGDWGRMAARGWLVVAAGLSIGLAAGAMGMQGARPTIDTDPGSPWLGRASRTMVAASIGGIAVALAVLGLRSYAGQWAAVLLVVVLLLAAVLWAIVAISPGFRERSRGHEKDVTSNRPIKDVH